MNDSAVNGAAVNDEPMGHGRAFELLPWLANESLSPDERRRVERHVRDCLPCRVELKEQQALAALVRDHPTVHVSAEEGYERLRQAMDAQSPPLRRGRSLPGLRSGAGRLAAAAALLAAVGGAAWIGWTTSRPATDRRDAPRYATAADAVGDERARIDVIFADGTTEEQMRALLEELGATIVGGPTSLGRYTLQLRSDSPFAGPSDAELESLIRRLLSDSRVRFAGRTFAPAAANGDVP